MTVGELLEHLRQLPASTPVVVEGYETGLDVVVEVRLAAIARKRGAQDWDGEYSDVRSSGHGGTPAMVLLGRRGHRRGGIAAPPDTQR